MASDGLSFTTMITIPPTRQPEPWMRGTLTDVPPVQRAVLHAFELAIEDIERWCSQLSDEQLNARPHQLASVAFHIRHIIGSCDRLLSYAEGHEITADQLAYLKTELDAHSTRDELLANLRTAIAGYAIRVRAFTPEQYSEARGIGRKQLPTTVAGLLVHVADHSMRHVGQAITTAKLVIAL
jgi:uncharacterized damage-inducible protein DinB